jgi:hypothetical protein
MMSRQRKMSDGSRVRFRAGLASCAPYFHNGSADTLGGEIDFYNKRIDIGITPQEKRDLIALRNSLIVQSSSEPLRGSAQPHFQIATVVSLWRSAAYSVARPDTTCGSFGTAIPWVSMWKSS